MTKTIKGIKVEKNYVTQREDWTKSPVHLTFTPTELENGKLIGKYVIAYNGTTVKLDGYSTIGNDMRMELKSQLEDAMKILKLLNMPYEDELIIYRMICKIAPTFTI